ncbi:hypothetical protein HRbin02_01817 [Candidatus Calditenuaceae archaeon HR02]|nr:hypothetical protein HRbin02_01817 [Candidatus Calditenuaceae archaeon HR02]
MRHILLVVSLLASILFGIVLLTTDAELWDNAPSHAYGLIGLVLVDVVLIIISQRSKNGFLKHVRYIGVVKFLIILGDILTAPEFGITYLEFAEYLLSLWAYDGLLGSQLAIALSSHYHLRRLS